LQKFKLELPSAVWVEDARRSIQKRLITKDVTQATDDLKPVEQTHI